MGTPEGTLSLSPCQDYRRSRGKTSNSSGSGQCQHVKLCWRERHVGHSVCLEMDGGLFENYGAHGFVISYIALFGDDVYPENETSQDICRIILRLVFQGGNTLWQEACVRIVCLCMGLCMYRVHVCIYAVKRLE